MTMAANAGPAPSGPADRLVHLDVLRGFALLGVLLSNIQFWFRAPRGLLGLSNTAFPGFWNDLTSWLIRALIETKFVFLFSMLFGVGLAILVDRFEEVGARFLAFAARRLSVLLGMGILHALLLWNGDILVPYAVLGFLTLPFLRRQTRTLYAWVIGLWVVIVVLVLAEPVRTMLGQPFPPPSPERLAALDQDALRSSGSMTSAYLSTSWLEVTRFRVLDYARVLKENLASTPILFANLLTGIALWRSGLLRRPAQYRERLVRFARWALPVGLALHAIYASKAAIRLWGYGLPWTVRSALPVAVDLAMVLGAVALSLGLGATVLVVMTNERWGRRLSPLAALGRTALSTYVFQSLVMTAIFYGWGLGFYGHVGPAAGAALGLVFFAVQFQVSVWWVRHFRFGPLEWAWRCATYLARQPFVARESHEHAAATTGDERIAS